MTPHIATCYDMIIGRDMLQPLGIDIRFSDNIIEWDQHDMPFKDLVSDDEEQ